MAKTTQTLKPDQRLAIIALIETGQISEAAKASGRTRETVHKWLRDDRLFVEALREAEKDALQTLSRRLVSLGAKASAVIEQTLDDPKTSPTVRLRAADMVLGRLLQLRELIDLEERIQALEAKVTQ